MFGGGPKTGHKCKAYLNTGTHGTPAWAELKDIGDLALSDLETALAELKRRGSNFTKALPGIFNLFAAEFRLHHGLDATVFTALRTAFFSQTPIEVAIMNGPIDADGSQGLRMPVLVSQFPWQQGLDEVHGHDVRLALAWDVDEGDVEIDPEWLVIEGSP